MYSLPHWFGRGSQISFSLEVTRERLAFRPSVMVRLHADLDCLAVEPCKMLGSGGKTVTEELLPLVTPGVLFRTR